MNKNITIPMSDTSTKENARIEPFRFKPLSKITGKNIIETRQSGIFARFYDLCLYFSAVLFMLITLQLLINFINQDKMEMDEQTTDEKMVLLGVTSICQFEILRPNCETKNLSEQTEKPDKNQTRQESVEQKAPGSDYSQRIFFATNDITASGRQ